MKNINETKHFNFTVSGSKNNKIFKILWISALMAAAILFIAGSIWDWKIAKGLGDTNDNGFISWLSMFWDKMINTLVVPAIFMITGIILESFNKRYGKNQKQWAIIISVIYALFIIVFVVALIFVTIGVVNKDVGFGPGRDYWFGLDPWNIIVVMSIHITVAVITMIFFALFLRFNFSKRDDLLTRNYWIDGVKVIVMFAFMSVLVHLAMKNFWGRPYFVHVDFQHVVAELPKHWGANPDDVVNAKYIDWWIINGFNPDYWDAVFSGDFGNTHWDDVAFPSSHMNATQMLVYSFVLLCMNEKRGQKITWWKWLIFAMVASNVAVMAFMQIVSRTHYISDLMFTIMAVLLLFKPISYVTDHVIYFILSLIWTKTSTEQKVVSFEKNNKTIICIDIDNVYWTVAKVRTAKIESSKKYKRWHSNNFVNQK